MSFEIAEFNKVNELVNLEGFPFVVNSEHTKLLWHKVVDELFEKNKYLTFDAPRIGRDRSLPQSALFHVWLTEAAAYYLSKHKKDVTPNDVEAMKWHVKKSFYVEHRQPWMIQVLKNPINGETKKDYTSSASWKRGEMMMVLDWMQMKMASDGLILEAIGEYEALKRKQQNT